MHPSRSIPDLAVVVTLTAGGPYAPGDACSLAFLGATVGRLVPHDNYDLPSPPPDANVVPESITVRVVRAAGNYRLGALLTLSFVDPTVVRIHEQAVVGDTDDRDPKIAARGELRSTNAPAYRSTHVPPHGSTAAASVESTLGTETIDARGFDSKTRSATFEPEDPIGTTLAIVQTPPGMWSDTSRPIVDDERRAEAMREWVDDDRGITFAHAQRPPERAYDEFGLAPSVEVYLEWKPDRVRRFVTVVDKLFTVERLGWYRHVLAMRLLVPDRISCGDAPADVEAMRHLHALRAACVETFGRPMLAAFMPNFVVTPDWLERIESPAAARALAGVRDAIAPFVGDGIGIDVVPTSDRWTVGRIDRGDLDGTPTASVEALMPVLVASVATNHLLTDRLSAYRRALIDVFGQTAHAAEAVRLGAMTQPNHSLDDRLWQLVGAIGETFGGLAVA